MGVKNSVYITSILMPLCISILGSAVVVKLWQDAFHKVISVEPDRILEAANTYKAFNDLKSVKKSDSFASNFYHKFPSLKGKVEIEQSDSDDIWIVSMDGKSLFFPKDLAFAIEGNLMRFPSSMTSQESNQSNATVTNQSSKYQEEPKRAGNEPIPPKHVGLVRAEYAAGLATVNKDLLPYYKATANRNDDDPRYLITFVDSTCPACKRFIQQIPSLNSMGIDVYLAPFARNGAHTKTAKLMTTVWCNRSNERRLENIERMKKGAVLQSECVDTMYLDNINASLAFGDGFLNQTTPVSFTNNGVIVIANLDPKGFDEAFRFGNDFAEYVASNIIGKE